MVTTKNETNNAIVARLQNVRKHSNADKLQIATVLGDTVVVGLDSKEGDLVIYFDSNICLNPAFLYNNNLYSDKTMNKDQNIRGYFGKNGKVKAQLFRGEKSYGFVAYPECFSYIPVALEFTEGLEFYAIDGVEICKKYIVPIKSTNTNRQPSVKKATGFIQHWDTKQFKRCIDNIPVNRLLYIEEKLHGTSARSALVLNKLKLNWFEKLLQLYKINISTVEYQYCNGSRRVNLKLGDKAWYKGDVRQVIFDKIKPSLYHNEQVYYEIIGYDTNGRAIQAGFPYGCQTGEYKAILYRISMNDLLGNAVETSREYVYNRAKKLGLEAPPLLEKYYYTGNKEELMSIVSKHTDGLSMVDNKTLREGVVVWYENEYGNWTCLKNKSFDFLDKESKDKEKGVEDMEDMA